MDCKHVQNELPFYARADVMPEERLAVARHLSHCGNCRQAMAEEQHTDRLVRGYLASAPIGDVQEANVEIVSRVSQPRFQFALARGVATLLITLGLVLILAATAVAVYNRIVVVEPSQEIPSLEEAINRAPFPLWVSNVGELWRVSELGEGRQYTVHLDYRLDDGRRFTVENTDSDGALLLDGKAGKLIQRDLDINGNKAVLFLNRNVDVNGRSEWSGPNLYWRAGGTSLRLSPWGRSAFTNDELITIARSMAPVPQDDPMAVLDEIVRRVTYPIFAPGDLPAGTQLTWVGEIGGNGWPHTTTYLWYVIADGREFRVSQRAYEPRDHRWEDVEVVQHLEVHGQPATLYVPYEPLYINARGDSEPNPGASTKLALSWHEGQTEFAIVGELTQEDIITIAESMREISP